MLQVTLPTNFKVARSRDEKATAMLRALEKEIDVVRFEVPEDASNCRSLRVYDLDLRPVAKVGDAACGNHRCITPTAWTAKEAVHSDIATSRSVYNFVIDPASKLGRARTTWCRSKSAQKRRRA